MRVGVMPNGADGLNPAVLDLGFPLTGALDYLIADPNKGLSVRDLFDQPTVEEMLKDIIRASQGWNSAAQSLFSGLPFGVPFVIGIVAKVAEQITGIPVSVWTDQWLADPNVSNVASVVGDALGQIFTVSTHIQALLGSLDFLDPGFDPSAAAQEFFEAMLLPLNFFGGFSGTGSMLEQLVDAFTGSPGDLGDLSSFFAGLVPLPDLVESLTGAPGDLTDISGWVSNLPVVEDIVGAIIGAPGNLLDLSNWSSTVVDQTQMDDLLDVLGGDFGSTLNAVIDRMDDLLSTSSPLPTENLIGEIVDDIIPSLGSFRDAINTALTGILRTGTTTDQVQTIMTAQNDALVGAQSQIARLNQAFTSGVSAYDDFERYDSNDAGPNWSLLYGSGPGNVYLDGHNLAWDLPSLTSTPRTVRARWLGPNATSSTDYQRVEMVLNGVPQEAPLLSLTSSPAANDIILRADAGMSNYIRIRFRGDGQVIISRFVSGAETVMNSGPISGLAAGASIGGEAGRFGTARYFRALVNGFPALDVTEAGTASQLGTAFRGWGWGMHAGSKTDLILIPAQTRPGSVKQWTASDLAIA